MTRAIPSGRTDDPKCGKLVLLIRGNLDKKQMGTQINFFLLISSLMKDKRVGSLYLSTIVFFLHRIERKFQHNQLILFTGWVFSKISLSVYHLHVKIPRNYNTNYI